MNTPTPQDAPHDGGRLGALLKPNGQEKTADKAAVGSTPEA